MNLMIIKKEFFNQINKADTRNYNRNVESLDLSIVININDYLKILQEQSVILSIKVKSAKINQEKRFRRSNSEFKEELKIRSYCQHGGYVWHYI